MGHAPRFASAAELPEHLRRQVEARLAPPQPPRPQPAPRIEQAAEPLRVRRQPTTSPAKHRRGDPEHLEQVELVKRLQALAAQDPGRYALAVRRTIAIPNGGHRSRRAAGRLKAEGTRPGVSDLLVALPVGGQAGLWLEMKSATGRPSREQIAWGHESIEVGYAFAVARGADEGLRLWLDYVHGRWQV